MLYNATTIFLQVMCMKTKMFLNHGFWRPKFVTQAAMTIEGIVLLNKPTNFWQSSQMMKQFLFVNICPFYSNFCELAQQCWLSSNEIYLIRKGSCIIVNADIICPQTLYMAEYEAELSLF
jgi:hypothetical protein